MRIDSSGNVGINVVPTNAGSTYKFLTMAASTGAFFQAYGGSSSDARVFAENAYGGTGMFSNHPFLFYTNSAERMRIDSSGNLLVGTTTGTDFRLRVTRSGNLGLAAFTNTDTSGLSYDQTQIIVGQAASSAFHFVRHYASAGATQQFSVRGDGTIFAQNTTVQSISDARTKENIVNATDGLDVVNALRPVRFDFKEGFGNDKKNQLGFIAQEIEQVFPDAVDIWDESDDPENPYKSVGTTSLIPVLVKAIQEQQTLINQLTTRLNALEGK
jgi:ABC-type Fe3+ transport system substrate-binding protein